ncbi:MAG: PrgI family protein [Patescibacteria group bacterium]
MDQVTVPQFIESEDKILGPITVRQFVIMFVAAIILFLVYKIADFSVFIVSCVPIGGGTFIFGFLKVNGQPFHFFILHIIQTLKKPSLRVWRRTIDMGGFSFFHGKTKPAIDDIDEGDAPIPDHPHLAGRKLSTLALIVDTGGAYMGQNEKGEELF